MNLGFGVLLFAAVMLIVSAVKAEELVAQGFSTAGDAGDPKGQGTQAASASIVQALQAGLQAAARAQLSGESINAAVPTYQPLTKWRSFKRNLDVYVNPSVSVETKTGRFVSAKTAADLLGRSDMDLAEAADLWTDSGALVGVMIDDSVVAVTPELAEKMGLKYRDLIEAVVSSVKTQSEPVECCKNYGYLFPDESLHSAGLGAADDWGDAPPFITWGYQSQMLPSNTAEKLGESQLGR